ncbi:hypothetical protein D3C77_668520 [compost metagenome]
MPRDQHAGGHLPLDGNVSLVSENAADSGGVLPIECRIIRPFMFTVDDDTDGTPSIGFGLAV